MRALAATRRNPVALTNLGTIFGREVTACGLSTISPVLRESLKQGKGAQRQYASRATYPRRIASLSAVRSNPQG